MTMHKKHTHLLDEDGEIRELTDENFFNHAKTLNELPAEMQANLRAVTKRGPQRAPIKELVTIRLSKDVVSHFRDSGRGWQARVDDALKKAVEAGIA